MALSPTIRLSWPAIRMLSASESGGPAVTGTANVDNGPEHDCREAAHKAAVVSTAAPRQPQARREQWRRQEKRNRLVIQD